MKIFALLFLSSQFMHAAIHSFYIGTRTDRESKGIYLADFDDSTGALSNLRLAVAYKEPGFLCLNPQKKLLYAVGQRADGTGTLATFSIEKNQTLSFIGDVPSGGHDPCHLAIDATAQMIAVANYGSGSTSTFSLDKKGVPSEVVSLESPKGKSINPQRQTSAHAHGVYFSEATLFVPDLGLDQILAFSFDPKTAEIKPATPAFSATTGGDGPRHLAIHSKKPWVYVVNELSNTVTHYTRDQHRLTAQKSITTLPQGFTGENTTAEIEIHPNGRFLYASNRGHQSIAAYSINHETGELSALGETVAEVVSPRHFIIAPGGAYLIVAGQESNNLQVLSIDPQSGQLAPTSQKLTVPSPICLLFAQP